MQFPSGFSYYENNTSGSYRPMGIYVHQMNAKYNLQAECGVLAAGVSFPFLFPVPFPLFSPPRFLPFSPTFNAATQAKFGNNWLEKFRRQSSPVRGTFLPIVSKLNKQVVLLLINCIATDFRSKYLQVVLLFNTALATRPRNSTMSWCFLRCILLTRWRLCRSDLRLLYIKWLISYFSRNGFNT